MSSVDENETSPQGFSVYIPFSGAHPCSIDNIYRISQMWSTPAGYEERAVWFNSVFVCFRKCHVLFLGLNSKTLCATVPVVPKTVRPHWAIAFPPSARAPNFPWFLWQLKATLQLQRWYKGFHKLIQSAAKDTHNYWTDFDCDTYVQVSRDGVVTEVWGSSPGLSKWNVLHQCEVIINKKISDGQDDLFKVTL